MMKLKPFGALSAFIQQTSSDQLNFKSKVEYPYSYDPIIQFLLPGVEANNTIYTDRLLQWDFPRHDELCLKHFGDSGQYWDYRSSVAIEAFLKDWVGDKELVLVSKTEYCDRSSGHPTWRLDFKSTK